MGRPLKALIDLEEASREHSRQMFTEKMRRISGCSIWAADLAYNMFMAVLITELEKGQSLFLPGIGIFYVKQRGTTLKNARAVSEGGGDEEAPKQYELCFQEAKQMRQTMRGLKNPLKVVAPTERSRWNPLSN